MKITQSKQTSSKKLPQDLAVAPEKNKKKLESTANSKFSQLIKDGELRFNLENVSGGDILLLGAFLSNATSVRILSVDSEDKRQAGTPRMQKTAPKPSTSKPLFIKSESAFRMRMSNTFMGLRDLLKKSEKLTTLAFKGMVFTTESIEYLSEGLKENASLRGLIFSSCVFPSDKDFDDLSTALSLQRTLETLEISSSGLTNAASASIKKVINGHAARRNEIVWVCGLRGEEAKSNKQGLGQLILSKNKFSDQFVFDLLPMLSYDQYLRSINLSANDIKGNGVQELLNWLESSQNTVNLDLRENPGYTAMSHKRVVQALARNIKKLRSDRAGLKKMLRKKWISEELLSYYVNGETEEEAEVAHKRSPKKKIKKKEHRNLRGRKDAFGEVKAETDRIPEKPICEKKPKNYQPAVALGEDCKSISYSDDLIPSEELPCKMCGKYFKELMQSESRCISLIMENKALKRQLRNQPAIPPQQLSVLSGIHPMIPPDANTNTGIMPQHESISLIAQGNTSTKYVCGTGDDGSEELRQRIDFLMAELTRLMDNLENPAASQNNTTENNFGNITNNSMNVGNVTGIPRRAGGS